AQDVARESRLRASEPGEVELVQQDAVRRLHLRTAKLGVGTRIGAARSKRVFRGTKTLDQANVLRVVQRELLLRQESPEFVVRKRHDGSRLKACVADQQPLGG